MLGDDDLIVRAYWRLIKCHPKALTVQDLAFCAPESESWLEVLLQERVLPAGAVRVSETRPQGRPPVYRLITLDEGKAAKGSGKNAGQGGATAPAVGGAVGNASAVQPHGGGGGEPQMPAQGRDLPAGEPKAAPAKKAQKAPAAALAVPQPYAIDLVYCPPQSLGLPPEMLALSSSSAAMGTSDGGDNAAAAAAVARCEAALLSCLTRAYPFAVSVPGFIQHARSAAGGSLTSVDLAAAPAALAALACAGRVEAYAAADDAGGTPENAGTDEPMFSVYVRLLQPLALPAV